MASDDYANVKDYYMDGKINIANDHVWNKKRQDYGRDWKIGKNHSLSPILVLRSINRIETLGFSILDIRSKKSAYNILNIHI